MTSVKNVISVPINRSLQKVNAVHVHTGKQHLQKVQSPHYSATKQVSFFLVLRSSVIGSNILKTAIHFMINDRVGCIGSLNL